MLRVRLGADRSVACTRICVCRQPPFRRPRSLGACAYSTETNRKNDKQSGKESYQTLAVKARQLERRLLSLERSRLDAKKKSKDTKPATLTPDPEDNDAEASNTAKDEEGTAEFNDALDVIRRVYGVKKAASTSRKKITIPQPPPKANESEPKPDEEDVQITPPASTAPPKPTGVWTTLQEKLRQLSTGSCSTSVDSTPLFQNPETVSVLAPSRSTPDEPSIAPPPEPPKKTVKVERKRKKATPKSDWDVKTLRPNDVAFDPVEEDPNLKVPKLSHNLDKVLFNRGVYELQDRRSRVYNFDPYLATIMPVDEFDFNALAEYITSSKDNRLRELTSKHGKKFCGSTSSMTSMLSHFHFLISNWRPLNFSHLSRSFNVEFENYTVLTRAPAAAFARLKDGVYAIDGDKEFDTANILSMLGKSMEKLLTLPKEDFEKYRRSRSHQLTEEEKNSEEGFHYTTLGDFMMRSQLDAHDHRLPGSGMFDLKTRAVVSIRMDVQGYEKGVGYELGHRFGQFESYEREYYDMIRAAFLKYSLQVRMGRMDGIFVAFHNTERIFGFQYISLEEMDSALHSTNNRRLGDQEFRASVALLNDVLNRATERFPGKSLRLHVETRPTNPPLTYFFAEAVTEEEADRTQAAGKAKAEQFESQVLGLSRKRIEDDSAGENDEDLEESQRDEDMEEEDAKQEAQKAWNELMAKVDDTVEDDSLGLRSVREAIEEAMDQSGLLHGKSVEEKEKYLDSLVEALSAELEAGKEPADEPEEDPEIREEGEQTESEQGEEKPTVPETLETQTKLSDKASADALGRSDLTADMEPSIANGSSTMEEGLDGKGTNISGQDSSLKDLILKVAQGVDNNNKRQNLGAFERVLSELATQTEEPEPELSEEAESKDDSSANAEPSESVSLEKPAEPTKELLGMYITVRNKIDNEPVSRAHGVDVKPGSGKDWAIEYTVVELPHDKAHKIYEQLKKRRKKALIGTDPAQRSELWHKLWRGNLDKMTRRGRRFRKMMKKKDSAGPTYGAWSREPLATEGEADQGKTGEKEEEKETGESKSV